jgi:hypothetical protein
MDYLIMLIHLWYGAGLFGLPQSLHLLRSRPRTDPVDPAASVSERRDEPLWDEDVDGSLAA